MHGPTVPGIIKFVFLFVVVVLFYCGQVLFKVVNEHQRCFEFTEDLTKDVKKNHLLKAMHGFVYFGTLLNQIKIHQKFEDDILISLRVGIVSTPQIVYCCFGASHLHLYTYRFSFFSLSLLTV